MDEGFTTYAETRISSRFQADNGFAFAGSYDGYFRLVNSGKEEPMSTHSDHYNTNFAYSVAAYSKGCIFMEQLGYIVGQPTLDKILLAYYNEWRFKHPNPNDFIRVAEKVSGMELQWYKEYWVYTTKTIDYALGDINTVNGKTILSVKRIGNMPMPVDVLITYKDGTKEMHNIPMNLMYGAKKAENNTPLLVHGEWKWTQPEYSFAIVKGVKDIKEVEIDPSGRMADVNRVNNKISLP